MHLALQWLTYLRENKQDTSFDTLYQLAKKLEVHHQPHGMAKGGTSIHDTHKGYKKYSTPRGCAATVEADLFPPDPELVESAPPKPDHIEGLLMRMTQAMNHYQKQEHCCFVCRDTGHFMQDCPHHEAFHTWYKEHLNLQGAGQKKRMLAPKNNLLK